MAKGVALRRLSRRGSWVQIPPPALLSNPSHATRLLSESLEAVSFSDLRARVIKHIAL
jgi:hypothetical protein